MALSSSLKVSFAVTQAPFEDHHEVQTTHICSSIGIAYQLRPLDPLVDAEQCQRDVALMKELGANTLRVYHVDAKGDHDGCMQVFADAGIHILIDLDTLDTYILPVRILSILINRESELIRIYRAISSGIAHSLTDMPR